MMISKEEQVDFEEKYNKVIKLLDESKFDSPNTPFASKYAAREILHVMKNNLENLLHNEDATSKQQRKLKVMLSAVYVYSGMISIDVEESSTGETYLQKCLTIIEEILEDADIILISLNLYNQFGILWSQSEPEKSKTHLEKAEKLYLDFKKTQQQPSDISELFKYNNEPDPPNATKNMEKIYTLTLYYLAQIYGALKDTLKSAVYCHNTLQRQLDSGDYEPIDWALNAATLSQFFMEKNGFKQARHHLAASSLILTQYEQQLNAITERNDEYDSKMETFKHRSADVARCWAKYGLLLLLKSKERLLNHTDDIDVNCTLPSDLRNMTLEMGAGVTSEDLQKLDFPSLDLFEFEMQITDNYILTIQDARLVFLNIQTWLQKAASYYTLETLASDHIEIVQDQSQMYLNLLFFEDNIENQAKLHKRRIILMEGLINKINPQFYLQYCRQLWFELAQTYFDILNIKSDKLRDTKERPTPQILAKINHFVERSIHNFNCFIDSFKDCMKDGVPVKIPEDFQKPVLQAYFHIAALNSRYVTLDKKAQLENTEASLKAYTTVYKYCQHHQKATEEIPMEYNICKEMFELLPVKIAKIKLEIT